VGLGVEAVAEGNADLGEESASDLDHAQVVDEVVEVPSLALAVAQILGIDGFLPLLPGSFLERAKALALGRAQQLFLRARTLGLGPRDLSCLLPPELAVDDRH